MEFKTKLLGVVALGFLIGFGWWYLREAPQKTPQIRSTELPTATETDEMSLERCRSIVQAKPVPKPLPLNSPTGGRVSESITRAVANVNVQLQKMQDECRAKHPELR